MENFGKTNFDTSLNLPEKEEEDGGKEFCFSSCFIQKRESRLGAQATENSRSLAEVRAPRLLGGWGENSASLPDRSI